MPWTLANAVQNEQDPFRRGVLSVFWMESNLMAAVPFETINRLKIEMRRIARLSLTKSSWVDLGASLTSATVDIDSLEEEVWKLGRDIDIPRDLANLDGQFEDPRVVNIEANVKSLAYEFNDAIVNGPNIGDAAGSPEPRAVTGISLRIDNVAGLTGLAAAKTATAANGTPFGSSASSANRHTVLDAIDAVIYFIADHTPDWGVTNDTVLLAINSAFRREGTLYQQTRDQYERWVSTLRGIPLYDAGLKFDQSTKIIGTAETQGSSSDASSIYFIRNGVGTYFHAFEKEPMSVRDLGELQTAPTLRTRLEWLLGFASWHPRALGRVSGIRATT